MLAKHTMLWRGGHRIPHECFFNQQTGKLDLTAIETVGGDFSRKPRTYWTPQRETADRYAAYVKHHALLSEVVIVQVAVPWDFLEGLTVKRLWTWGEDHPNEDWRQVIWNSRRRRRLPDEVKQYGQAELLMGHIATSLPVKYMKMDSHAEIGDDEVMKVMIAGKKTPALQWVFQKERTQAEFERVCQGRVWMHYLGALIQPGDNQ
jgi:hypothetical protein